MSELTHFDAYGNAVMVDVSSKPETVRVAVAQGVIHCSDAVINTINSRTNKKGDVLTVAQLAGIMGAKQTSTLIPLCHPLPINAVNLELTVGGDHVLVVATVKTSGKTGVEMEALTAVSVALLTVYDMCKAIDKSMRIGSIELVEKSGGRSGHYRRSPQTR